jgi:glycosyltransferase involved in cell wall biosynthesis
MRILAVTTWLPTPGSPSTGAFVVRDAQAIAGLGHDVHLVHLMPPGQYAEGLAERGTTGGLPVTRVPMSTSNPWQIARAGRRLRGMAEHADLLHTMAFSTLLPMATWRPAAPWVHTEHWSGLTAPQTLPTAWQKALPTLKRLLARPDVVTAVCEYLARPIRAVRDTSGRANPTLVVPCIVPVPEPVPPRPADQRRLRIVSIGGLIERKDPLLAVDTLAELLARGRNSTLTFVGQGPLEAEIRQRARTLDITERVRLTGSLDRDGVLDQLGRAHLFLGPTRGDNFFVSCAEAIVAGRPVVVGSTGGQGEYIDPAVGQTVDTQSAVAYADAVESVVHRTQGLSAQQISDTIGQRFSVESVAAGYQDAYDQARGPRR